MLKVLVCVSGGGTNLNAIIKAVEEKRIENAEIVRVLSSKAHVKALDIAAAASIPCVTVQKKDYEDAGKYEEALIGAINDAAPDLIVLAGFLVVLPERVIDAYPNRIINVHPSLIPSFCGMGFYGLKVHEEALKRGVKLTGATVHFVDKGCDTGPIIFQKSVAVLENDTPEILQKRVMEEAEWVLLPKAISEIAAGNIEVKDGKVYRKSFY
ncbi:MAG: phosphoribosylglycinamide formyltransferase [Lachnospiraceae bacterium]|nr:phosphoribosylglycinamide formyltransferase [Lachnospiraceae bacterium]